MREPASEWGKLVVEWVTTEVEWMMGLNKGSVLKSVKIGILMGGALALSACSFFKSAECGSSDT